MTFEVRQRLVTLDGADRDYEVTVWRWPDTTCVASDRVERAEAVSWFDALASASGPRYLLPGTHAAGLLVCYLDGHRVTPEAFREALDRNATHR